LLPDLRHDFFVDSPQLDRSQRHGLASSRFGHQMA
jgi:hypothetical protein